MMIIFWRKISVKRVFRKMEWHWETQKKSEKRELAKNKWYNQMVQVGTSWSTWNKRYKEKRVFRSTWNKWNKEKGVFRSSWNKWNKDKGSVQLNISTCSKVGLQGRVLELHPKTLIEIAMILSTNSGSFPSNSHISATFSILIRFGEFWNPTNYEKFNADGSLMGRTNLDKSVW